MAEPGDIATEGKTNGVHGVVVHAIGVSSFALCKGCPWSRNVDQSAEPAISHVAHFGHDVMLTTFTTSMMTHAVPSTTEVGA